MKIVTIPARELLVEDASGGRAVNLSLLPSLHESASTQRVRGGDLSADQEGEGTLPAPTIRASVLNLLHGATRPFRELRVRDLFFLGPMRRSTTRLPSRTAITAVFARQATRDRFSQGQRPFRSQTVRSANEWLAPEMDGGTRRHKTESAEVLRELARSLEPAHQTFAIQRAGGSISRAYRTADLEKLGEKEIVMPEDLEPRMSVATLKALLEAPDEIVLLKAADHWQPVGDDHMIDLTDSSQQYMVGPITVYS